MSSSRSRSRHREDDFEDDKESSKFRPYHRYRSRSRSYRSDDQEEDKESRSHHYRSKSWSRHRSDDHEDDKELSKSRSHHYRSRSSSRHRSDDYKDDKEFSTSRSYYRHRSRSRSRHRHRGDNEHEEKESSKFPPYHRPRSRHGSITTSAATPTSSSTFKDRLDTVLRLKQNQIWPRIEASVYNYLRNGGWDDESSKMIEVDPSTVHSVLISSMVGVGGTVSSSIALQRWIEDNQTETGPAPEPEERPDEDEHRHLLKKIQDDIEIELQLELDIVVRMLQMMELKRGVHVQKKKQASSTFVLRSGQRVILLDLVVWALENWKTLNSGGSCWRKHKVIKFFESFFLKVAHQIRVESAISSHLNASTRSLGLLRRMKSIQSRWVELCESISSIRLRLASSKNQFKNGQANTVQELEKAVAEEVEDKTNRTRLKPESLVYLEPYEKALEQLEKDCRRNSGDKSTQGKLIKEMLQLFKSSVALNKGHRDHSFFTIMPGHVANAGLTFKRAVVWVLLGILPHLQEKGAAIRLFHAMQGVFRQAISGVSGTDGKREVTTWRKILETYLTEETMEFFYHRVQDRPTLEAVGCFEAAKNFEYFYPSTNNEEPLVTYTQLLSTATTPVIERNSVTRTRSTSSAREEEDQRILIPYIQPNVVDFEPEVAILENQVETSSTSDTMESEEYDVELLKTLKLTVSTLSLEEKEDDPWEIKEINYDDYDLELDDNFREMIDNDCTSES